MPFPQLRHTDGPRFNFTRRSIGSDRHAQFGRARARVFLQFLFVRPHRLAGLQCELRLFLFNLGRIAVRAPRLARAGLEKPFHHSVFNGVESDNGQLPAGLQSTFSGHQPLKQFFIFCIHGDPQPLKAARGRVGLTRFRTRQAGFDDLGQTQGRGDRLFRARFDDRSGNPAAGALFTIVEQNVGQLRLGRGIDQIGGAFAIWLMRMSKDHSS